MNLLTLIASAIGAGLVAMLVMRWLGYRSGDRRSRLIIAIALAVFIPLAEIAFFYAYRLGVLDQEEAQWAQARLEHREPLSSYLSGSHLAGQCLRHGTGEHGMEVIDLMSEIHWGEQCANYIAGVVDAATLLSSLSGQKLWCGDASKNPDRKAIAEYIDRNPSVGEGPAARAVILAMGALYSCEK